MKIFAAIPAVLHRGQDLGRVDLERVERLGTV